MTTARNSRVRRGAAAAIALAMAWLAGSGVSAHRRDEFLQAARLDVDLQRASVELAMTPGITVADAVIADIDADHDGRLSSQEQQAYSTRVTSAIALEIDGRLVPLQSLRASFPDLDGLRGGEGTIRLSLAAALPMQSAGVHHILYRNTHRPDVSVYLANAVVPDSDRIAITAQRRDPDQRELTVDYIVRAGPAAAGGIWLIVCLAVVTLTLHVVMQRRQTSH